ncbi:nitroreductase family protein [Heliorestis acidaminivorans]|uniref:Nitroreductase family protein n=1 Tax=Heliorestis acidaminivorans TaxID=553427 RepID=A0A6I0F4V2_9FIRM|nr:nitroreductase family protein [Heliorestis acidaminivorans]KAB2954543.1 nitroreductase family protein [Heliorestis acidaminivorans]
MELTQAIRERRSIRKYKTEEPPRDLIEKVVEDGLWAPSSTNQQPWHFFVVRGEEKGKLSQIIAPAGKVILPKLERAFKDKPKVIQATLEFFDTLGGAPILICCYSQSAPITAQPDSTPTYLRTCNIDRLGKIQSVAAAIQNIMLSAHSVGLGTCWMTAPLHVADDINKTVGIKDHELVALITMGYADGTAVVPPRKEGRLSWIGF